MDGDSSIKMEINAHHHDSHFVLRTKTCGQMTFLLSHAFIIIYLSWALIPALLSSSRDLVVAPQDERDDGHHHYPLRIYNSWAAYIPTYLALLFLFAPPLYMGLNMKSVPPDDGIDWIWDTRSNTINDDNSKTISTTAAAAAGEGGGVTATATKLEKCNNDNGNSFEIDYSLPEICDVDVRTINARVHRNIKNATGNARR